tara:strand:+ start:1178 stop:1393 length:216 start_codon:yes stop_codon:yes gene_type:complete
MEFLLLNGHGIFVWPAFIFTFFSCLFLYLKSRKELKNLEKIYLKDFNQIQTIKIQLEKRKVAKESLLSRSF